MGRPDGRIEKGQRLGSAISARAWNRAQDAADVVLGVTPGFSADGLATRGFPCVRGTFNIGTPRYGYVYRTSSIGDGLSITSANTTFSTWTDLEKKAVSLADRPLNVVLTQAMPLNGNYDDDHFVVNIDNETTFAVSGFAIARIRAFHNRHRFARLPVQHPGIDNSAADGALDSCFFGRARIVGYVAPSTSDATIPTLGFSSSVMIYPTYEMRWALIQF